MKSAPRLPDLASLTSGQKDQLIVSLWQTVLAMDGIGQRPLVDSHTVPPGTPELQARIAATAASRRAWTPHHRRATGTSQLLIALLLVIAVGFFADFAIAQYEHRSLEVRNRDGLALENAAFNGLDTELLRVVYEPDGTSYRAVVAMHNTYTAPLYIMLNPVRVFVQVGQSWQEQPAHAVAGAAWSVVELRGDQDYQVAFRIDAKDWRELIPGYMHVRIDSDMLISGRSDPGRDIVERNNRFYAYLKPQNYDATIKQRSNFPGPPPVFILMPPH